MKSRIILGTRGSRLALLQAESVAARIKADWPDVEIELRKVVTEGDRNQSINLDQAGGIGIFVKALEEELIRGRIDLAVHSLKDLPTTLPENLCLAAVTEREDPRDALVARTRLESLPAGASIGTGSLRRTVQLKIIRPDLCVCGLRGNVDTRLNRVARGEMDGIIVAAAALHRLNLAGKITQYLPEDVFIPAIGQGALAVEARKDDMDVTYIAQPLNHLPSWRAVAAERSFLHALGGGCRAPIAALAVIQEESLTISGMIADNERIRILYDRLEHPAEAPDEAGALLARKMLDKGGADIISGVRCQ